MTVHSEVYLTDNQLLDRWHCSPMTLWRLRKRGVLPKPLKLGPSRNARNLTPMKAVEEAEQGTLYG